MSKPFTDVIANPPANLNAWDTVLIKENGFHVKYRKTLRQMFRNHKDILVRVNKEAQDYIDFPQFFVKTYLDNNPGMTRAQAESEVADDTVLYTRKRRKLMTILKCLRAEHEIRDLLATISQQPALGITEDTDG